MYSIRSGRICIQSFETDKCARLIRSDSVLPLEKREVVKIYICDGVCQKIISWPKAYAASICSGICECKEIDVSTLINHFMISEPPEESLNEVAWTVYAIFKRAGRASCTLKMQHDQVEISGRQRRRLSPHSSSFTCLWYLTAAAPKPNLLTVWISQ